MTILQKVLILATSLKTSYIIILMIQTKLFLNLYLIKFLNLTKLFFLRVNIVMKEILL